MSELAFVIKHGIHKKKKKKKLGRNVNRKSGLSEFNISKQIDFQSRVDYKDAYLKV